MSDRKIVAVSLNTKEFTMFNKMQQYLNKKSVVTISNSDVVKLALKEYYEMLSNSDDYDEFLKENLNATL